MQMSLETLGNVSARWSVGEVVDAHYECDTIRIHLDAEEEDFWIEAIPDANPRALGALLRELELLGLTLIEDDECEPQDRPSGYVRRWLA